METTRGLVILVARISVRKDMVPTVCSKKVELLDSDKLKNELRRLERRTNRSGKESIDHPPRGSDDIANAVAGVTWLALQEGEFTMPEAYGETVCRNYMDGLNDESMERNWI